MTRKTVRDVIDTRLSGIEVTDKQRNLIMMQLKKEALPVKRKISTSVLVAALILALLTATAFAAANLLRTDESEALRLARHAVFDTYGLTPETLGLFIAEPTQQGSSWTILFKPYVGDDFDKGLMGQYNITLKKGKTTQVQWTHDDVEPYLWQDSGLDAPAWGQHQLLLALDRKGKLDNTYSGGNDESADSEPVTVVIDANASAAAKQVMIEQFGFTDATLTFFAETAVQSEAGEEGMVDVIYVPSYSEEMCFDYVLGEYYITLNPVTNEVIQTHWSMEDLVDDTVYTEKTWGDAPAYPATFIPWLVKLFEDANEIAAPYGLDARNSTSQYELSIVDKGKYDQLFRDAGFGRERRHYIRLVPDENDISPEMAQEIACQALMEDMSLTREQVDAGKFDGELHLDKDNQREYFFWFYPSKGDEHYSVWINAQTGELQFIDVVSGGIG